MFSTQIVLLTGNQVAAHAVLDTMNEGKWRWRAVRQEELGESTGLKEEQGVVERGVGSCSWILSVVSHSCSACWDPFLTYTPRARNLAHAHQGSSVSFFPLVVYDTSRDFVQIPRMETSVVVVLGREARKLVCFFFSELEVVLEKVPS